MRWRPEFALPVKATEVPPGPDWFHEVKYDGYRIMVIREPDRVRLITKSGVDCTKRFPWIADAARTNRRKQFIIDGEAVLLGVDGVSDFDGLHSGKHNDEVQLYAIDSWPLTARTCANCRCRCARPTWSGCSPGEHGERWYGAGRCKHWVKVKNPKHPAYRRVQDQF
jgi:bifunctional non-homologous end joining protein LigD